MSSGELTTDELIRLVRGVFGWTAADRSMAILLDLPGGSAPDHPAWRERRALAADWHRRLSEDESGQAPQEVALIHYANVGSNNANLPTHGFPAQEGPPPETVQDLNGRPGVPFEELFERHRVLMALTEFSATAPLKLAAPRHGFRAATMGGFGPAMIPALKLDYEEVHRRCVELKGHLDAAIGAEIEFEAGGVRCLLFLDLRHRSAIASGGLIREPGTAGNLPSGETYIVPYEGERPGDPSRTRGRLPLEREGRLLVYTIEGNRLRSVDGEGPVADAEREKISREPAYANVAELGLGVLADYGVQPVGELLLDEKLGLHIAFGRSDHFGGSVGAGDFTSPDQVVHIDHVYLPQVQPSVRVLRVDLEQPGEQGRAMLPLMRDGVYV